MTDKLPIAILAAAGFEETTFTDFQKALLAAGHAAKVVTPDGGLVQGWHEEAWGHHFMADENLADMLSADFSGLIVPDGERSNSTLAENPHARRFVKAFVENGKPVLAVADAVSLLAIAEVAAGRRVTGPEAQRDALSKAGAEWTVDEVIVTNENIVTTGEQASNAARLDAFLALFDENPVQEAA
ncbi:MAG: DJ-1/PfpI family protein [Rhodospirillaceae bacterium]|jgi:protease I